MYISLVIIQICIIFLLISVYLRVLSVPKSMIYYLFLSLCAIIIKANHFNGGTITWMPVDPYDNSSSIMVTVIQSSSERSSVINCIYYWFSTASGWFYQYSIYCKCRFATVCYCQQNSWDSNISFECQFRWWYTLPMVKLYFRISSAKTIWRRRTYKPSWRRRNFL